VSHCSHFSLLYHFSSAFALFNRIFFVKIMVTVADTNNTTENDVQQQILRQVEFYFSDANFSTDKFLQGIAEKNDGCILYVFVCASMCMCVGG
jgi:hypothetical protein